MPFILFLYLLVSCQKSENISNSFEKENRDLTQVKFKAKIIELPSPNKYQIKLNWDQGYSWLLYRENEKEGLKHLLTLTEQTKEYLDTQVVSGESYNYFLAALQNDEILLKEKLVISIPKDLYINEQTDKFTIIRGPHRLFLGPQARMITDGRFLKIDVDEIFSEKARIITFEKPAVSAQKGRSGGTLLIRAKKATGILTIVGNGEDGGKGMDGAPGIDGRKGENGGPATIRRSELYLDLLRNYNLRNIDCTATEDSIVEVSKRSDLHSNWKCLSPPTNGTSGENGGNGSKGSPGLKGGDSAKIYVEIKESSQFQIYPEQKAGHGGEGGWGGRLGRGGKGGTAGLNFAQHFCSNAQKGTDGKDGEVGTDGEKGEPGEIQPYCLKLGNIELGNCDKFVVSPEGEVW